ncbi:MAG: FecR family protein [Pirellulales bacterium]|nr:FecR family protein [Pirellulales bacterium]
MDDQERDESVVAEAMRMASAFCDGQLDELQLQQLEEQLIKNTVFRQEYCRACANHSEIQIELRSSTEPDVRDLLLQADALARTSGLDASNSIRIHFLRHRTKWALCLAASFMAIIALWRSWYDTRTATASIGLLSCTSEAVWTGERTVGAPVPIYAGETLRLRSGNAQIALDSGVVLNFRGPAKLAVSSNMHVVASYGTVRCRVGPNAHGFELETPKSRVVDLGTEFGVNISPKGDTDVVVFEGEVDVCIDENLKATPVTQTQNLPVRMTAGESLSLSRSNVMGRVMTILDGEYPSTLDSLPRRMQPVIGKVWDNRNSSSGVNTFYEIMPGGFAEDCRAFVDRYHQWNSIGTKLPEELAGGDYVRTFNRDKWNPDVEIQVELTAPAVVYLLLDARVTPPAWLSKTFERTSLSVGIDEGWADASGRQYALDEERLVPYSHSQGPLPDYGRFRTGRGPGKSINNFAFVWKRVVPAPSVVTLGSLGASKGDSTMYGIVVKPLAKSVSPSIKL